MIDNIKLIAQSAIRIKNSDDKIIYFDPYKLDDEYLNDADYIFITHPHYDHFSEEDINKIKKSDTKIISVFELEDKIKNLGFINENITLVKPNESYTVDNLNFNTVQAYNLNKDFHKKEYNWVGYVININNKVMYVAGDTDNIPEIRNIKCDVAFVPVGGTYTMTSNEAVDLIKEIKPNLAIPIHYKTIVGSEEDAFNFKEKLENIVDVNIIM